MSSQNKVRTCTVCKQNITLLGKDGIPTYYRVIERVYNWYCGPTCATAHHEMGYKPIEEKEEVDGQRG